MFSGSITIIGPGSTPRASGDDNRVVVGYGAPGVSGAGDVANGAAIDTRCLDIGQYGSTATATGSGSSIRATTQNGLSTGSNSHQAGHIDLGRNGGSGILNALGGATAHIAPGDTADTNTEAPVLVSGADTASSGTVTIDGVGSSVAVTRVAIPLTGEDGGARIVVGRSGTGSLTIRNGGSAFVDSGVNLASVVVGANSGSSGALVVTGAGSRLSLSGGSPVVTSTDESGVHTSNSGFVVGRSGNGSLEVSNGGTIDFSATTGGAGVVEVGDGGSLIANNVYVGSTGTLRGVGAVTGTVNNMGGLVAPGGNSSIGTLAVDGDHVRTAGALSIRAASASNVSALNVPGGATVTGGSETFTFVNGYTPAAGDGPRHIIAGDHGSRRMTTSGGPRASAEYEGFRFTGDLGVRHACQWSDSLPRRTGSPFDRATLGWDNSIPTSRFPTSSPTGWRPTACSASTTTSPPARLRPTPI